MEATSVFFLYLYRIDYSSMYVSYNGRDLVILCSFCNLFISCFSDFYIALTSVYRIVRFLTVRLYDTVKELLDVDQMLPVQSTTPHLSNAAQRKLGRIPRT